LSSVDLLGLGDLAFPALLHFVVLFRRHANMYNQIKMMETLL
jgi:hypothetical protein